MHVTAHLTSNYMIQTISEKANCHKFAMDASDMKLQIGVNICQ